MINRIRKFEQILNLSNDLLVELEAILEKIEKNQVDYSQLLDYYGSQEYMEDVQIANHSNQLANVPHGVLSEDAVFNLIAGMRSAQIKMLEVTTEYFKVN